MIGMIEEGGGGEGRARRLHEGRGYLGEERG